MYLTGNLWNFEQRLHQLPENTGDLQQFYIEYQSYTGELFMTGKFIKEFNKKESIFRCEIPLE